MKQIRKSKIETHPDRIIIVKLLASGEEYSGIIRDFPKLTSDDLDADNKLHAVLSKLYDLKGRN